MIHSTHGPKNYFYSKQQFIFKISLAALACIVSLYVTPLQAENSKADTPDKAQDLAAVVNGVPIKLDELDPLVNADMKKFRKYGIRRQDEDVMNAMRKQTLEKLITVELLYQEARKSKIDDLDKRVTERLSAMEEKNEGHTNLDKDKIRKTISKQILIEEYLVRNKLKDAEPPESDIKAYYEENKKGFTQKESARTRHILVSVAADASPNEKAAAREKITEARKLVLDGKPFDEIAIAYSDCSSAPGGGELGYQERGYMPKAFDDVAFSLETGQVSDIVETEFGFHVIEVLDHKLAGIQPYAEVKDFISKYLKIQHSKKAMNAHISALRKKAKVDIYL
ncbi:MAG: peptidylprolyl isomerase [Candidatus Thiodiazotropha sp.]